MIRMMVPKSEGKDEGISEWDAWTRTNRLKAARPRFSAAMVCFFKYHHHRHKSCKSVSRCPLFNFHSAQCHNVTAVPLNCFIIISAAQGKKQKAQQLPYFASHPHPQMPLFVLMTIRCNNSVFFGKSSSIEFSLARAALTETRDLAYSR